METSERVTRQDGYREERRYSAKDAIGLQNEKGHQSTKDPKEEGTPERAERREEGLE